MENNRIIQLCFEPTKYRILTALFEGTNTISKLAKKLGISEPAVSQQLTLLKKTGLVTGERKGHYVYYEVNRLLFLDAIDEARANVMRMGR